MKDIIITAGGKNVSPVADRERAQGLAVRQGGLVIGDGRKFLTALIGIELDTVGDWAQRQRLGYSTLPRPDRRSRRSSTWSRAVVDDVNSRFASVEQIKAFRLLPKELDHEDGELTATQKVKRAAVVAAFDDLVESMYDGGRAMTDLPRVASSGGWASGRSTPCWPSASSSSSRRRG